MRIRAVLPLLACVAAALLAVSTSAAQSVRGRILDAETGQGIPGVRVTLLKAGGGRVGEVISNAAGGFQILAKDVGEHRIRASHIGYRDLTTDAFLIQSLEQVVVDVKLATAAITLQPLTIVARQRDPRHAPTEEGFYARRLLSPPIGSKRVILPHDPEMAGAAVVTDVLAWLPRARSCTVVYWNGTLVQSADVATEWLNTSVTQLEGVEYYRTRLDAPAAFRDLPPYLGFENVQCSVIALWPRTGRYLAEDPPVPLPPYLWSAYLTTPISLISGTHAPGIGFGVEAASHWPLRGNLGIGLLVRGTFHNLDAETANELSANLSNHQYSLPPGKRGQQLWVLGVEPRLTLRRLEPVEVVVGARLQVAQRRFTLASAEVGNRNIGILSRGWGLGASAALEMQISERIGANAALVQDWLSFAAYRQIDPRITPTAATWSVSSLRFGIVYSPGQ